MHDLVVNELRRYLAETAEDFFVQGPWSEDEFRERIGRYEAASLRLQATMCCIAHWGEEEHKPLFKKIMSRLTERAQSESGLVVWLGLRWYPALLVTYCGGIAAVAAGRYDNLASLLTARVSSGRSASETKPLASALARGSYRAQDSFKTLPGHERHHVPRSEYLFIRAQCLGSQFKWND